MSGLPCWKSAFAALFLRVFSPCSGGPNNWEIQKTQEKPDLLTPPSLRRFHRKGAFFSRQRGLARSPNSTRHHPPDPPPRFWETPYWDFQQTSPPLWGGGGGGGPWSLGSARPLYREKKGPFSMKTPSFEPCMALQKGPRALLSTQPPRKWPRNSTGENPTLVGTLGGALAGAFVGELMGPLVNPCAL